MKKLLVLFCLVIPSTASALTIAIDGDFTADGVVDGADFLHWQRYQKLASEFGCAERLVRQALRMCGVAR